VPPLRDRVDELPALAQGIVDRLAARTGEPARPLSDAACARLAAHAWPGDLAELEAVLARGLLVPTGAAIAPPRPLPHPPPPPRTAPLPPAPAGAQGAPGGP